MNYVNCLQSIPQPEQRSPAWYEQRASLITSSNISTILDLNPYKTSQAYMQELLDPTLRVFKGNVATVHGTFYEDPAIDAYLDAFHYTGVNLGLVRACDNPFHRQSSFIESRNLHWLAGSVDKLVWASEVSEPTQADCIAVENKCPYYAPNLKYGTVKTHYWPQLQFNMFILDTDRGDYVEMVPEGFKKNKFKMNAVRIYRDDAWILGYALPKLEEFYQSWQHQKQKKTSIIVK